MRECMCNRTHHEPKLMVLTGGPGAGKTTVLEVVRRHFCEHVTVLPEAASILFGGGFPRDGSASGRRAAQRAIFHVQRELEQQAVAEGYAGLILCDRGSVDGVAYWPGDVAEFWDEVGSTPEVELARYAAVVHLRTPTVADGYGYANPLRIESAAEAHELDERTLAAWSRHPQRAVVRDHTDFMRKVSRTLALIAEEVPSCCRVRPLSLPAP